MSFDITFLMHDTDRSNIYAKVERYLSDECGVCEQEEDADIYWPSSISRWAHHKCVALITPAESNLIATIHTFFKDDRRKQNLAHMLAIKAVKNHCSPDTISVFTAKNGIEMITKLFNTVGVEAVKNLAAEMQQNQKRDDIQGVKVYFSTASFTEFGFAKL